MGMATLAMGNTNTERGRTAMDIMRTITRMIFILAYQFLARTLVKWYIRGVGEDARLRADLTEL